MEDRDIAGAVYDFAAYLTTRKEGFSVGSSHDASRMANEVSDWCKARNVDADDANVLHWDDSRRKIP